MSEPAVLAPVAELRRKAVQYHFATCDQCKCSIHGIRYKCTGCHDFDLCGDCEAIHTSTPVHQQDHVFAKLHNREGYHVVQKIINAERHRESQEKEVKVSPSRHQPLSGGRMPRVEALETQVKALQEMVRQLSSPKDESAPANPFPAAFLYC